MAVGRMRSAWSADRNSPRVKACWPDASVICHCSQSRSDTGCDRVRATCCCGRVRGCHGAGHHRTRLKCSTSPTGSSPAGRPLSDRAGLRRRTTGAHEFGGERGGRAAGGGARTRSTPSSCPGGWSLGEVLRNQALVSWIGPRRPGRAGSPPYVADPFCWPRRACWTADAPPRTGRTARTMARRYPEVTVDAEPIFVWDGPFVTSAGVSTGIDMALALVEADHGAALALGDGTVSGALPQAARRTVPVQRGAGRPVGRPSRRSGPRRSGSWRTSTTRYPWPRSPAGQHEPAQLRPGLPPRGGHDPRPVRRAHADRPRPRAAGDDRSADRSDGRPLWIRAPPRRSSAPSDEALGLTPKEYRHRFQVVTPSGLVDRRHESGQEPRMTAMTREIPRKTGAPGRLPGRGVGQGRGHPHVRRRRRQHRGPVRRRPPRRHRPRCRRQARVLGASPWPTDTPEPPGASAWSPPPRAAAR